MGNTTLWIGEAVSGGQGAGGGGRDGCVRQKSASLGGFRSHGRCQAGATQSAPVPIAAVSLGMGSEREEGERRLQPSPSSTCSRQGN